MLDTHVRREESGWRWFVYDTDTGHILAQGYCKREATANRQVKEAKLLVDHDLFQGVTR